MQWYDWLGTAGVALIVISYLLLQLNRLPATAPTYSLLNGIGAGLILISLHFEFNLSAFIIEAFWLAISLYGLVRALRPGQGRAHGVDETGCEDNA